MNAVLEINPMQEVVYPEQRETDLGETSIHYQIISKLMQMLTYFENRNDIFIASNMNLYYEEGNPQKWYAPDLMIAFGVGNHNRSSYKVWDEGVFPNVIFEVASDRTWKVDLTDKLELYGELGTQEYYILDTKDYLPLPLMAYRTNGKRLVYQPAENNRIYSPLLNLEIVENENTFRLYDTENKEFLMTIQEMKAELERLRKRD